MSAAREKKKASASRYLRVVKLDRILTDFAGLLSDLGADEFLADVAAMRAKNAQQMCNEDQSAAYIRLSSH